MERVEAELLIPGDGEPVRNGVVVWEGPRITCAGAAAGDLRAALDAGVTSVREVGGLGVYLARAVQEGTLEGPAVYGAGAISARTAATGTCTRCRLPGWPTSAGATVSSGSATAWTAASRPSANSCATTPS